MTDPPALLASLAQEAYALAQALESVREQLPPAPAVRHSLALDQPVVAGTGPPVRAVLPGPRHPAALDVIKELVRAAEREVTVVVPGDEAGWRWSVAVAPLIGAAAARGCRVRVLFGCPIDEATQAVEWVAAAGCQIRVGPVPSVPMLTTDRAAALLAVAQPAATVITQEFLVKILRDLVGLAWSCAAPLAQAHRAAAQTCTMAPQADAVVRHGLQRQILQLLAEGAKDETIARMLGISVRTCRRHVAEIMASLDAVSRFQAGANAALLGLTGNASGPGPDR